MLSGFHFFGDIIDFSLGNEIKKLIRLFDFFFHFRELARVSFIYIYPSNFHENNYHKCDNQLIFKGDFP